jgi:hypothetical protein
MNISAAQKSRLAFIDFSLNFLGHLSRNTVMQRFEIGHAAVTRDLALYKQIAPENLKLNNSTKLYEKQANFSPAYPLDINQVLSALTSGFADGSKEQTGVPINTEQAQFICKPDLKILATLSQAIYNQHAVTVSYESTSSGKSTRNIAPHSFVDNGRRWHVRAYDFKRQCFSDFVLNRFYSAQIDNDCPLQDTNKLSEDEQWQSHVDLILIPHPNLSYKKAIELDYDMKDGQKRFTVRAAIAGYLLRNLNVDCSNTASFSEQCPHLALSNLEVLNEFKNAYLAPGYNK